jgi:putative phosphoesterase
MTARPSSPDYHDVVGRPKTVEKSARIAVRDDGALRLAVVADTHSAPHPAITGHLTTLSPDAILHAGDIGNLTVLDELEAIAPLFAIRGNIDVRAPSLPDVLTLDVVAGDSLLLRILLMHIAVDGPRLRVDAARLARARDASLVVCGHSHVPLIAARRRPLGVQPRLRGSTTVQLADPLGHHRRHPDRRSSRALRLRDRAAMGAEAAHSVKPRVVVARAINVGSSAALRPLTCRAHGSTLAA